ncbi:beta family protein [Rheinheimera sp. EpRS3]|uniref:beta family protein n=1 Tax=Rheinheimera sp. EpRS3 TaxID=1712383 RepID=UPI0007481EC7|nr:hypothetical protein [Rheinheimera sp. EpRS3]KUM54994.1 hypothetical protein AR688_17275 [Rheinheimera sp. EpRS3]
MKYVPFLKAKQNEIRALSLLSKERIKEIIPFFDIPRPNKISQSEIVNNVLSARKSMGMAQEFHPFWFYLDVFDIPSGINVGGVPFYQFVLNEFSDYSVIPVIGLDREPEHLQSVLNTLGDKAYLAIRLVDEDLLSFNITKNKLEKLFSQFNGDISFDLILDCRIVNEQNYEAMANNCSSFLNRCDELDSVQDIIVTSSSITSPISELIDPQSSCTFTRYENSLWDKLDFISQKDVIYGDYTVVSPEYSDVNIPVEIMRNVQCPKIIYTQLDVAFGVRGGALKTHGDYQFYDLAKEVLNCGLYRGKHFSNGDDYIERVANRTLTKKVKGGVIVTTCGSPSKWIETTVNCHISFIIDNI